MLIGNLKQIHLLELSGFQQRVNYFDPVQQGQNEKEHDRT